MYLDNCKLYSVEGYSSVDIINILHAVVINYFSGDISNFSLVSN